MIYTTVSARHSESAPKPLIYVRPGVHIPSRARAPVIATSLKVLDVAECFSDRIVPALSALSPVLNAVHADVSS